MVKFADDTYLIAPAVNSYTCEMRTDIGLSTWAKHNNLKLNFGKSKEILFWARQAGKQAVHQSPNPRQSIPRVSSLTVLGVIVDDRLSFSEHVGVTLKSCVKRCALFEYFERTGCQPNHYMTYSLLSNILYCSTVWSGYCSVVDHKRFDAFIRRAKNWLLMR